jgi:hypothetical protein
MTKNNYLVAGDPVGELAIAETMAQELEDYIIKDDLYRTISASTPEGEQRLQMTGGDLLSRLHRLQAQRDQLTPDQQTRLAAVQKAVDTTIYSLRTRFHERLQRETKARLDALNWYLSDLATDRTRARTEYPFEIRNRERIEGIVQELGADLSSDLSQNLSKIDQRIRTVTATSGFIWDERLKSAYPQNPYWYLYVTA